jgi:quinolinate synthase
MKRTGLEQVYQALRDLQPEVKVPAALQRAALAPIQRMLDLGIAPGGPQGPACRC